MLERVIMRDRNKINFRNCVGAPFSQEAGLWDLVLLGVDVTVSLKGRWILSILMKIELHLFRAALRIYVTFREVSYSFSVNSLPVLFVLASSWAEDTEASMNSQFISPGIGGSLLWFFSFTVLFAFSGIFVCFVCGMRSREETSFLWQCWELILQWSVQFYGQAFCP